MKKNIILFLLSLVTFQVSSQEIVDREKLTSFQQESEKLTEYIYWYFDSYEGEWFSKKDTLSLFSWKYNHKSIFKQNDSLYLKKHDFSKIEGFNNIQTKSVFYQNKNYYILIIESKRFNQKSDFKYNDVYFILDVLIFTENEWQKIQNINSEETILLNCMRYFRHSYSKDINLDIEKEIEERKLLLYRIQEENLKSKKKKNKYENDLLEIEKLRLEIGLNELERYKLFIKEQDYSESKLLKKIAYNILYPIKTDGVYFNIKKYKDNVRFNFKKEITSEYFECKEEEFKKIINLK